MEKFEYKIIKSKDFDYKYLENLFNVLGEEGWELINSHAVNTSSGTVWEIYNLKRISCE